MNIKLLHILETADGGLATYLCLLDQNLPSSWEQSLVVPTGDATNFDAGMSVKTFKADKRSVTGIWRMIQTMRHTLRSDQPDIVFFHSTFSLLGLMAARMTGWRGRAVYCSHGWAQSRYDEGCWKARLVAAIEGRLCGLADVTINISDADQNLAIQSGYKGRHVLVENAVPPPAPTVRADLFADEPDALHLLFVGRLDHQKGYDLLLSAFEEAYKTRKDLRLHVVGASVRADSAASALPEGVTSAGWIDRATIDDWYASADALIVPSRWEGFGLVVPEALRNGTPALVSDRGALPALVTSKQTGETFSLEGRSLVDCLLTLDRSNLRSRAEPCKKSYQQRFSIARWSTEIQSLFNDLMTEKKT